jgi:adenosylcobinamide kinase/adenosylcobinamide-phosphate guanylyltransferase
MGRVTLITGGARSGKSSHALLLARELAGESARCFFVATAQGLDEEMRVRIEHHRTTRSPEFRTREEPLALTGALAQLDSAADVVLIDCLTLWISNLLGAGLSDEAIVAEASDLAKVLRQSSFASVVVTDEVGSGIVPEHPIARRFRDLLGWTNQKIAEVSDSVLLMVSGCPIRAK